tara:strand:- start:2315 stop:2776 length:462 start_codon:yes stop_codon:yes gene_type:complete
MNKEEFKKLIVLFDDTYPKQPKLTTAQQLMLWVSLQHYSVDAVMAAFISHTNDPEIGEWKPQVPVNLTKYLQQSDVSIKALYQQFFERKDVQDDIAKSVWNQLGGNRLLKLPQYETDKKEEVFVNLYKQRMIGNNYDKLPNDLKTKLIGVLKK